MTVSRLANRSAPGSLQEAPPRQPKLYRFNGEPAVTFSRTVRTWPNTIAGGWVRKWSGDQLTKYEPSGLDNCMDQTGAVCPKFAEVRTRQAMAERQLVEFNHRLANVLQMLVTRIERQRRIQEGPGQKGRA